MDQRERNSDITEALRVAIAGDRALLWTALPCLVESVVDLASQLTISAQPTIKANLRQVDGTFKWVNLPLLLDVVVAFPMGGGVSITFPLAVGDEVLVVFACRCIDGWWEQGGVQLPAEFRFHDMSDGFAIPGVRSLARPLANVSTTSAQIRTDDGQVIIDVDPTSGELTLTAQGAVTINAPAGLVINGNVVVNGSIMATMEVVAQTAATPIPLSTHLHPGVSSGLDNTGVPIP